MAQKRADRASVRFRACSCLLELLTRLSRDAGVHGRVDPKLRATRVELRWHGGKQRPAYRGNFFVAAAPALEESPFRQLPSDVVVYDANGQITRRSRIPTSFLYLDWKRVQPLLHKYRVAHGCARTIIWRCKSH